MLLEYPLVLVGPMGVGKTTVGKKLARALGVPFRDTDAIVTASHGPIPAIFDKLGEDTFRAFEEDALREALSSPAVVATGGGAVLRKANQQLLESATVIYLSTDGKHIPSRLRAGNRPLVKNGYEDWKRIYSERKTTYESVADHTIDTSGMSLALTVAAIREKLNL